MGARRVSDADRDQAIDLLRVRCAERYLSLDTLSRRVVAAYRAKTATQLEVSARDAGERGRLLIGRSRACDIHLADPSISRRHAELRHSGAGWSIQDLESLNGVVVNGRRVQRTPLEPADQIALGDTVLSFAVQA